VNSQKFRDKLYNALVEDADIASLIQAIAADNVPIDNVFEKAQPSTVHQQCCPTCPNCGNGSSSFYHLAETDGQWLCDKDDLFFEGCGWRGVLPEAQPCTGDPCGYPDTADPFLPDDAELLNQCVLWAVRQGGRVNVVERKPYHSVAGDLYVLRNEQIVVLGGVFEAILYDPRADHADTQLKAAMRGTPTPRQQKIAAALVGLQSGFGKRPDNSRWERLKITADGDVLQEDMPFAAFYSSVRDFFKVYGHLAAYEPLIGLMIERFEKIAERNGWMVWEPGADCSTPDNDAHP